MNAKVKVKKEKAGRKRRALGWTLLTLGVLVAGVWAWSGWRRSLELAHDDQMCYTISGGTICATHRYAPDVFFPSDMFVRYPRWRFEWNMPQPSRVRYEWSVPFWPISILLWIPAALLLRSGILARRRAMTGTCAKCGYSLAGLAADALCPECGKASAVAAP